ncbi:MAG: hypothetical protein K5672_04130, partial [Bacteroidaceae bacterium]|nr:hypothetical protein [Bacteroidaceae bacterium]
NIKTDVGGTGLFGSVVDATIKNLVLDGSVESSQKWIGGIAGITRGNKTLIENVLVKSTVRFTGTGDSTAGGLCGDMEHAFTVNNCAFVGSFDIPNGTNVGGFVSWTGGGKFNNCYVAPVEVSGESYKDFVHGGSGSCNNCYAVDKNDEKLSNGELCYLLSDKKFHNPAWYQLIGVDEYPNHDSSRGAVIMIGQQYYSLAESTVSGVVEALQSHYTNLYEDSIAYTGVVEDFYSKMEKLEDVTTVAQLEDALDTLYAGKAVVEASIAVYKRYQDKCEEIKVYLDEHDDFSGPARDALESYLEDDYPEIWEAHELPDSVIEKEIVHVEEMLTLAIQNGIIPGTEVTNLFVNTDFQSGIQDGWASSMNKYATTHSTVTIEEKPYYGCEAWNTKFDMHQTAKGLQPGYYLVSVQGAFRPSNDRYSYNYAAQIYANDNVNYLQTVIEDYVNAAAAMNGQNVYLSQMGGGNTTFDLPIYEDLLSTSDDTGTLDILGYAVHGPSGMAVAGYAGRYVNYIIAKVEADSLTIGITNPGTNYGSDWTGFSSFKVVYAGDDNTAEEYIDQALESMVARAIAILEQYRSERVLKFLLDEGQCPSYPADLKTAFEEAVAAADAAKGVEAKMAVVKTLSQLFKDFYEARQAYLEVYKAGIDAEVAIGEIVNYLGDDVDAVYNQVAGILDGYASGTYSIEEAKNMTMFKEKPLADVLPSLVDGYYEIGSPMHFMYFHAVASKSNNKANAKLINDVDMASVVDLHPISGTYSGTFDGQGFALSNVDIACDPQITTQCTALFNTINGATIKNLKLTGKIVATDKFMGTLAGWCSKSTIENCEIAIHMVSAMGTEGNTVDGTHGGLFGNHAKGGAGTTITNCLIHNKFDGPNTKCWAGISGWADSNYSVNNCLVINDVADISKESGSAAIGRGTAPTLNGAYNLQNLGDKQGTKITEDQLASGEICFKLNGGAEIPVWYQTLGEDAYPVLDKTHLEVLYDENKGYYNWSDDPNGIENVNVNDNVNKEGIYNLAGQRLSRMQKGINIVGGKKILY